MPTRPPTTPSCRRNAARKRPIKLLKNPKIAPIIAQAEQRAENAIERAIENYAVSRERNVAELARLAYANLAHYTPPKAGHADAAELRLLKRIRSF
jgi:hypothetical protein